MQAFVLTIFFLFVAILSPQLAQAQIVGESCEPEFWEVLKQRSWLEAQREIEVVETLILKPDSVLEYSCFGQNVRALGRAADQMFSDNTRAPELFSTPQEFFPFDEYSTFILRLPGGPYPIPFPPLCALPVIGPSICVTSRHPEPPFDILAGFDMFDRRSLDNNLEDFILDSLGAYLEGNFDHDFLGNLSDLTERQQGPCDVMQRVWQFAKCSNFNDDAFGIDLFRDLRGDRIALNDPRRLYRSCMDTPQEIDSRRQMWEGAIEAAFPAPALPAEDGGMDRMRTRLDDLRSGQCGDPIETGLTVTKSVEGGPDEEFEDAFCLGVGCFYTGSRCAS